jgi:hypothetical protein
MRRRKRRARWLGVAVLAAATVSCCTTAGTVPGAQDDSAGVSTSPPSPLQATDDDIRAAATTWVNQLGLDQTDPVVWRARLSRACDEGAWDWDVAAALAQQFIAEDLVLSVRPATAGPPSPDQGAQALWIMTVAACRSRVPLEAIDRGPPPADQGAMGTTVPEGAGSLPSAPA